MSTYGSDQGSISGRTQWDENSHHPPSRPHSIGDQRRSGESAALAQQRSRSSDGEQTERASDAAPEYHVTPRERGVEAVRSSRPLRWWDVAALVINKMVGTGIFTGPAVVLEATRNKNVAIVLWILGFLYTLARQANISGLSDYRLLTHCFTACGYILNTHETYRTMVANLYMYACVEQRTDFANVPLD
jgi:hypothetical protein